jgi:hypothetical protein
VYAGENLNEGGLAGAVVTDEGDNFAGNHIKMDVSKGRDGPEMFVDAPEGKECVGSLRAFGMRCRH